MRNRNVLILCGGGGSFLNRLTKGFTMAEILLSLTIIGVVAAITLPSLTGNINERTWNTQRKALYARFSQAIALMPALNGYGSLSGTIDADGSQTITEDTAAETFVTEGLAKVLKINNVCDSEHLADCGIPSNVTTLNGSTAFNSFPTTLIDFNSYFNWTHSNQGYIYTYRQLNTKAAAFETQNGESIVVYYNPNCAPSMNETDSFKVQSKMCANFVYDLNGNKGPNTVGKDIGFITAIYPSDSVVVAPMPLTNVSATQSAQADAGKLCASMDSESRLPNNEEWISLFTNIPLIGEVASKSNFWSSTLLTPAIGWTMSEPTGMLFRTARTTKVFVRCVKR